MESDQGKLNLKLDQKLDSVEEYKFEPIKGYPMLHWKGKRPFSSTRYYPAQLKENHGQEVDGWMNRIYWGDNLQVMSHLLKEFRGKVDLVYIDPPFDSKADYKKKIEVKGERVSNDLHPFEEKQYTDIWTNDEYLQFMFERLTLIRELMSENGSIWLHCDWRKSHLLRGILDEIFGIDQFRAQITWRTMTSSGYKGKKSIGRSHADLLYYSKGKEFQYTPIFTGISAKMIGRYSHSDPDGRLWKDGFLGDVTQETVEELRKQNKLYVTSGGKYRIKHYLDESGGTIVDDFWDDINPENSQSSLMTGYPTQKPEALLERIIAMTSKPGDLVFDCFMGSGTTPTVSMKTGRRFIGADINMASIQTTTKRLLKYHEDLKQEVLKLDLETEGEETYIQPSYTGFSVYNVNHYDIFRNPVEAKELLIKALEITPLAQNSLYDGEKDGRMVKIMPVNRIATRADLMGLITGFDIKEFEKRSKGNPGKVVEEILLVCMGHEPDLGAYLKAEMLKTGFKLDVEVVDILRNRADLEFKRDAEAEMVAKGGFLEIVAFYPMNLLQKLSLNKENVEDWRELTESVMIDWNYDGSVFEPTLVDVPEKNDLVKGKYAVPKGAGTIRVKLTDLLSESLEMEVQHG